MNAELVGRTLNNRYQVQALVGCGGIADVYKVWDFHRGTPLAMKVLHPTLASNVSFLQLFQQEAQTLIKLLHPHIVRLYGLERAGPLLFMLLDYVEGGTLKERLSKSRLRVSETLQIGIPICTALRYAHLRGVIHADVKTSNVLLTNHGIPLLADFGIACFCGTFNPDLLGAGTATIMAPELMQGEVPSARSDIYAFGVLLYEMVTGQPPFTGSQAPIVGTRTERIHWEHLNLSPTPPGDANSGLPSNLENTILTCLSKRPEHRFFSTTELLVELEQSSRFSVGAIPETLSKLKTSTDHPVLLRRFTGWGQIAIVASVLLIIFILAITSFNSGPSLPDSINTNTESAVMLSPLSYSIGDCMSIVAIPGSAEVIECVTRITIQPNRQIQVFFSWTANLEQGIEIQKDSDAGNHNMYLTDDLGHRLDHTETGGTASQQIVMRDGDVFEGWFLFPEVDPSASWLIFHDEDNGVKSHQIPIRWP